MFFPCENQTFLLEPVFVSGHRDDFLTNSCLLHCLFMVKYPPPNIKTPILYFGGIFNPLRAHIFSLFEVEAEFGHKIFRPVSARFNMLIFAARHPHVALAHLLSYWDIQRLKAAELGYRLVDCIVQPYAQSAVLCDAEHFVKAFEKGEVWQSPVWIFVMCFQRGFSLP